MLKFFWNGIKDSGGKLQKVSYSDGKLVNYPAGTLSIYKTDYDHFSEEVANAFTVENDSDYQTDYVVQDIIRVLPTHPLYPSVLGALIKRNAHYDQKAR